MLTRAMPSVTRRILLSRGLTNFGDTGQALGPRCRRTAVDSCIDRAAATQKVPHGSQSLSDPPSYGCCLADAYLNVDLVEM